MARHVLPARRLRVNRREIKQIYNKYKPKKRQVPPPEPFDPEDQFLDFVDLLDPLAPAASRGRSLSEMYWRSRRPGLRWAFPLSTQKLVELYYPHARISPMFLSLRHACSRPESRREHMAHHLRPWHHVLAGLSRYHQVQVRLLCHHPSPFESDRKRCR